MKLSLFKKYLVTTISIILVSFLILGAFLMAFVSKYWNGLEKDQIKSSIGDIGSLVSDCMATSNGKIWIDDKNEWYMVEALCHSYNYDLIVTDSEGVVYKITRLDDEIKRGYRINSEIMKKLYESKNYESYEGTNDFYDDTEICVASPFKVQIGLTNTLAGYIFICSNETLQNDLPWQVFKIFLYAVVASLIVSCLLAGFFSYRQATVLKQLSQQARKLAIGDFSGRITVNRKDEIGQLSKAFNDMADALEKEEAVRRDFIANISHELKTPMTTISGFIDGILDGTIPRGKQDHYLSIVSEEITRLSNLVASMLSLARMESGKTNLNKSSFSLPQTIVSILMTFEPRLESKNIEIEGLETTDGITVYGDETLLHQVIYNLFENAVKFTPENGKIVFNAENRDNRIYFSIKNNGKSISKEDLPFIFDKFYKTDKSRSEDKKSMGLGLYIVKTIINLHGGEIVATSDTIKQETCFSAWIPEK